MRAYLQLFFSLLVPLSGLFIVVSIFWFKLDYDFSKAMRIGVLTGFFIGLSVSFLTSILLLILRRGNQPQTTPKRQRKRRDIQNTTTVKDNEKVEVKSSIPLVKQAAAKQKLMLLMDKSLAYEVALASISEQKLGTITTTNELEGKIVIQTQSEPIHVTISTLTKHTAQVILHCKEQTQSTKKIMHYLKEKEHSFLQY